MDEIILTVKTYAVYELDRDTNDYYEAGYDEPALPEDVYVGEDAINEFSKLVQDVDGDTFTVPEEVVISWQGKTAEIELNVSPFDFTLDLLKKEWEKAK